MELFPDRSATTRSRFKSLCGVAALIAVASLATTFLREEGDVKVYRRAAARMERGENNYRPDESSGWTYPPFQALFFIPLNHLPDPLDRLAWFTSQFAIVALIVWRLQALLARCGVDRRFLATSWMTRVLVSVAGVGSAYYVALPLLAGTNDLFILLFLVLGVEAFCLGRDRRSGFWFGIGVACKLTPLLFLPFLLWQRRWQATLVMVLTIASTSLLPDILYPQNSGDLWCVSWHRAFGSKVTVGQPAEAAGGWWNTDYHNQSLAGTTFRLCAPQSMWAALREHNLGRSLWPLEPAAIRRVTLCLLALTAGLLAFVTWRRTRPVDIDVNAVSRRFVQGSAVICAMLLLSPQSHKSHFGQLIVPLSALLAAFVVHPARRIPAILIAFASVCTFAVHRNFLGHDLGMVLQGYGPFTWAAIACFCGLAYVTARWPTVSGLSRIVPVAHRIAA